MQIPEPDVDMKDVEKRLNKKVGEFSYFKSLTFFKKGQWIIYTKDEEGLDNYRFFDSWDAVQIFSEIIKLKTLLSEIQQ